MHPHTPSPSLLHRADVAVAVRLRPLVAGSADAAADALHPADASVSADRGRGRGAAYGAGAAGATKHETRAANAGAYLCQDLRAPFQRRISYTATFTATRPSSAHRAWG
eukprot:6196564-Pleurochrysis_carterae.AAC.5